MMSLGTAAERYFQHFTSSSPFFQGLFFQHHGIVTPLDHESVFLKVQESPSANTRGSLYSFLLSGIVSFLLTALASLKCYLCVPQFSDTAWLGIPPRYASGLDTASRHQAEVCIYTA